ncbi:hypothetical protein P879_11517, partial [Paragonimus westermani]
MLIHPLYLTGESHTTSKLDQLPKLLNFFMCPNFYPNNYQSSIKCDLSTFLLHISSGHLSYKLFSKF